WPIIPDPGAGSGTISIGPPQLLGLPAQETYGAVLSPDGRRVAVAVRGRSQFAVFTLEKPDQWFLLPNPSGAGGLSFSPDGRWIATGNRRHHDGVKVWEAQSGKLIKQLPAYGATWAGFSPDGKALVICTDEEYRFWEADS